MKKWLINAIRLIKETFKWFVAGWPVYLTLFLIFWAFIIESEKILVGYGVALQIFAAISLFGGISSRLYNFRGKNLLQLPKEYLSKFPITRKRGNAVVGFKSDEVNSEDGEVKLSPIRKEQSFKDIPEVVKYFNEHIQSLQTSIGDERKALEKQLNNAYNKLSASQSETSKEVKDLRRIIDNISVSSINWEVFALFCLVLGLIISAWPNIF